MSAPTFEGDETRTRTAALLNAILWVFITVSILYAVFAPLEPEMRIRRAMIIISFVLTLLIVKQLVNLGHTNLAGYLIVFLL